MLDSGATGPGFKSQSWHCRVSLRQTVHIHRASVHQAAKLVAALLRVARVTEWWGAGVVICLERGADMHTAQLMPLPLTVSCSSKIQIGFTFLVPAHLGSPGKRVVKRVCVCVCVCVSPAGWLPRTGISSRTLCSVIEYGLPFPFLNDKSHQLLPKITCSASFHYNF